MTAFHVQWRVMFTKADPGAVGVQWRDEPVTASELAEWREHLICDIWAERRVVQYGEPERVSDFDLPTSTGEQP